MTTLTAVFIVAVILAACGLAVVLIIAVDETCPRCRGHDIFRDDRDGVRHCYRCGNEWGGERTC